MDRGGCGKFLVRGNLPTYPQPGPLPAHPQAGPLPAHPQPGPVRASCVFAERTRNRHSPAAGRPRTGCYRPGTPSGSRRSAASWLWVSAGRGPAATARAHLPGRGRQPGLVVGGGVALGVPGCRSWTAAFGRGPRDGAPGRGALRALAPPALTPRWVGGALISASQQADRRRRRSVVVRGTELRAEGPSRPGASCAYAPAPPALTPGLVVGGGRSPRSSTASSGHAASSAAVHR